MLEFFSSPSVLLLFFSDELTHYHGLIYQLHIDDSIWGDLHIWAGSANILTTEYTPLLLKIWPMD